MGDEEDEFTVFDTWDENNKPTAAPKKGGKGKKGAKSGEGLSWNQERQLWEKAGKSSFGNPFSSSARSSFGAWDLRASSFSSPNSLARIRSQAEKIFNNSVGDSIFTSP